MSTLTHGDRTFITYGPESGGFGGEMIVGGNGFSCGRRATTQVEKLDSLLHDPRQIAEAEASIRVAEEVSPGLGCTALRSELMK